jgi:M6 family metalloprotease-like protein
MKHRFIFLILPLLVLSSCVTFTSSIFDPSSSDSTVSSEVSSTSIISSSPNDSLSSSSSTIPMGSPFIPDSIDLVQDVVNFWSIPSTGNPKVLVVPVDFPNRRFANPTTVKANINTAFNGAGTSSFQSLNSFYKTSSFNKLDLVGDVLDIYTTSFNDSYYEDLADGVGNTTVINEIMNYYDGVIDFTDYDYNQDGYLDGIYMIYNHPEEGWDSFWWAYLWSYFGSSRFDGVLPTSYIWMPYEFVAVNNTIDTKTFIHETGHMLGLEDYYDYDQDDGSGNEYGLGGADMMDSNSGDHNPWSKMILGWIDPLVVDTSMAVELLPYISSGQALLITEKWNGTLFDEYIIAMYYTPTGFYRGENDYFFDGQKGLVLYHVDARLGPTAINPSAYPTDYINNNTDTPNKLIKFIEADGNNSLEVTGWMWDEDVYRPGDIFNGNRNLGYRFHQTSLGTVDFTIEFKSEANNRITLHIMY